MKNIGIIVLIALFSISESNGQHQKPALFLGLGVSANMYPGKQLDEIFNDTEGAYVGSIPVSLGLLVDGVNQVQLEYYFEDYFINETNTIQYDGQRYLMPITFVNGENVSGFRTFEISG